MLSRLCQFRDVDSPVMCPAELVGFWVSGLSLLTVTPSWVDVHGVKASLPDLDALPRPADVLSGATLPDFRKLRLRDPDSFRCGNLHHFSKQWDTMMASVKGYDVVKPWIHDGVHIPAFFCHYKGEFNGRFLDSVEPPRMYFQNDSV